MIILITFVQQVGDGMNGQLRHFQVPCLNLSEQQDYRDTSLLMTLHMVTITQHCLTSVPSEAYVNKTGMLVTLKNIANHLNKQNLLSFKWQVF